MSNVRNVTTIPLGWFWVVSMKVAISDPCYDTTVWCRGELKDVRPGRWDAQAVQADCGDWGRRIAALVAQIGEDAIAVDDPRWVDSEINVGVDSGQAGIFDARYYKDPKVAEGQPLCDYITDDPWYSMCCEQTSGETRAGVVPFGVVSSSGYGDGGYACHVIREDNAVIAIKIDFGILGADEEDEEEDES